MIVADSDVLVEALRGQEPALERIDNALSKGQLATTAINAFELLSAPRSSTERQRIEDLLEAVDLLELDREGYRAAANVRRDLLTWGRPIGLADSLVAGICVAKGLPLLSQRPAIFADIPGLTLVPIERSRPGTL